MERREPGEGNETRGWGRGGCPKVSTVRRESPACPVRCPRSLTLWKVTAFAHKEDWRDVNCPWVGCREDNEWQTWSDSPPIGSPVRAPMGAETAKEGHHACFNLDRTDSWQWGFPLSACMTEPASPVGRSITSHHRSTSLKTARQRQDPRTARQWPSLRQRPRGPASSAAVHWRLTEVPQMEEQMRLLTAGCGPLGSGRGLAGSALAPCECDVVCWCSGLQVPRLECSP